jgi:chromosome segregation ATPase
MSEDRTQQLPDDGVRLILARLDSMDARFDRMEMRFDSMESRLTALEEKVDRRLQDTRPIWEQVLSRLTDIEARLTSVEKRLEALESEVYDLGRKFRVFNADILKLQDKQEDLGERLRRLESERTK